MVEYTQIIEEYMRLRIIALTLVGIFSITGFAFAEMSSINYQIDWDSLNSGGSDTSASSSYQIKDTAGNAGAGTGTSASYEGQAGYRADYNVHAIPPGSGGPGPEPPEEEEEEEDCEADITGPTISGITTSSISTASAIISWTTGESAPGHVDYGTTTDYAAGTESETDETAHSITLSGLTASTTYYFQVEATDTCGNTTTSSGYSFTTTEADVAPANVTSFTATPGDSYVSLSWILPTDSDFAGTLIIYCLNDFPANYADEDCSTIYDGTDTNYTHRALTNDTIYYYGAFAYDAGGHYASGALASAVPSAEEPVVEEEEGEEPIEEPGEETGEEGGEEGGEETGEQAGEEGEETGGETGGAAGCGDAVCASDEDSFSCPSDCPSIAIPTTTVSEEELVPFTDISVTTSEGKVGLNLSEISGVTVLADTEVSFYLSKENINKEISEVILTLGADTYLLQSSDLYYFATIAIPEGIANYAAYLIVNYQDETAQTLDFVVKTASRGLIFEKIDGEENPVPAATVTLYERIGGDWVLWTPGSGQSNPVSTSDDGGFTWYVENGTYRIVATKNGYKETERTLTVENNIVNPTMEISKKIEIPLTINAAIEAISNLGETIQTITESPAAQITATVAASVVVVAAVTNIIVLTTFFDLLPFLQYLFTSPLLFFRRRKRKAFGVVYNAFTKTPIDLAIVRLYSLPENKLIRSRVTDRGGRYYFMVQPGQYRIEINKNGYNFPSVTLAEIKDDAIYLDVYHGENIVVSDKDVVITPNIPLEPISDERQKESGFVRRTKILRRSQQWLAFSGILISLLVFLIKMSAWSGAILGLQIMIYLLVRRLVAPRKPKSWGIVYDEKTRRPLGSVIVRIFEPKYHKLLETGVTDNRGRYTFLLGPNLYSSTFEKEGYNPASIQPIDYSREAEVKEWAQNINLKPKGDAPPPTKI